ncbi:MAG: glycosyltransferase [Chloroflexota bacterium]
MSRRIALISDHASPLATLGGIDAGGQNVYVDHLARQLARIGHEVDVFTRRDAPDLPPVVQRARGVRVIHVDAGPPEPVEKEALHPYMPAFAAAMRERLAADPRRYDLVHANFWLSGMVAVELKHALDLPFVITFHALGRVRRQFQGADDRFPDDRFTVEEEIVREADAVIAECPQDEEDLIRLYDADPDRVAVVPCGFDPEEFRPMSRPLARLELDLDPSERILLQLGRIVPRKGIDNVIEALARLERDHDMPARLLVVGGPDREPDVDGTPELARLAGVAEAEGVRERVTFVGRRDREELATYYNAADIFLSTPWYEPFGITPLEAMACGTPVVGSNVGGIKFSVRDGETGYLVPPRDPDALAERMAHLYRNPKLLAHLGRQGIRRVHDLFTWERVAGSVAELYEEVLATRRLAVDHEAERLAAIDSRFDAAILALRESKRRLRTGIAEAADLVCATFARDSKVLIAGNGGSAAEAQHFAAEFVGRYLVDGRPGLPAVALGTDAAVTSAWANDVAFEDVFARQVQALGSRGDLLVGLSTSGRSVNLVRAFEVARERGLKTLALLGGDGGDLRELADVALIVPSRDTQRIQEVHGLIVHLVAEVVERRLSEARWFGDGVPARSGDSTPGTAPEPLAGRTRPEPPRRRRRLTRSIGR